MNLTENLTQIRQQIPALQNCTYLNTGWSGPPPRQAAAALQNRLTLELEQGPTTPNIYESGRQIQQQTRQAAARLLGADPDETLITRNTTEGLNIILSGLNWQPDDEILTCNQEHSSVLAPSWHLTQRHQVKTRILTIHPQDPQDAIIHQFQTALTPRTRLIFISHIQYSTGLRMPAAALTQLAHQHGAQILIDGAQTAAHIPINVHQDNYDYYSIPGQKWALGYEGVGALYIRRDLIPQIHPAHTGGRAITQQGDPAQPHSHQLNPDTIEKFLGGSHSVPLQAAFLAALQLIENIGLPQIETRNLQLAARLKTQLAQNPAVTIHSPADPASSSGLVTFAHANHPPETLTARLWQQHRIVTRPIQHPPAIRASLHFFNTEAEIDQLANAIAQL